MSGALDGVIVLDMTRQFSAALSAAFLGDFGARVIRLHELAQGAPTAGDARWNHAADLCNRNKISIALAPGDERGRALLHSLAAHADVVLTDWPRAELAALGLDYVACSARRADLIYARLSGFGPVGPDSELPAIDELAAARTGTMPMLPQPGQPPVYTGAGAMHATVMLAFGIVTALLHRSASGEGQEVDVSLFGANMYSAALDIQAFLAIGGGERFLQPISRLDVSNPMSGSLYRCADGRWATLTMPDTDRWWPAFSGIVGLAAADPRFDSHEKRCEINRRALIAELEERFRQQPGSYWRRLFVEKRLSADLIEQFDYPAQDPQARANRYIIGLQHPSFGAIKSLGFPIFMSDTPAELDRLAPCFGQHSDAVARQVLGCSAEEVAALRAAGVVA